MTTTTNTERSLLALLMVVAAIAVFAPLCASPLNDSEVSLLAIATEMSGHGFGALFSLDYARNFAFNLYAYLVSVGINVFSLSDVAAVRLPSALVIWLLTVGVYHYRGSTEKRSTSFMAALVFLSSYIVISSANTATPLTLTTIFFIAAMASLYHWLKQSSPTKNALLAASTACSMLFFGFFTPIALMAVAVVFVIAQDKPDYLRLLHLALWMIAAIVITFFAVAFFANSRHVAEAVLGIGQFTEPLAEFSHLKMLAMQMVFAIFPWSIPLIMALVWIICHPRWLRDEFRTLSLLKQFGVIAFIFTIPLLSALNGLSFIMIIAAIYFNSPLVAEMMLSQQHNHSITWRIAGTLFAIIVMAVCAFAMMACCGANPTIGAFALKHFDCSAGFVTLLAVVAFNLYALWRNSRTINRSNRFLYNLISLYIVAQLLYTLYVNPNIHSL